MPAPLPQTRTVTITPARRTSHAGPAPSSSMRMMRLQSASLTTTACLATTALRQDGATMARPHRLKAAGARMSARAQEPGRCSKREHSSSGAQTNNSKKTKTQSLPSPTSSLSQRESTKVSGSPSAKQTQTAHTPRRARFASTSTGKLWSTRATSPME